MAKKKAAAKRTPRPRASLTVKLVILALLAATGLQLYRVQERVESAQAEKDRYAAQVAELQQENDSLKADIAEGATAEKIEEIARDELGYVTPGEYVFDTNN